jgi:hypothetical protein
MEDSSFVSTHAAARTGPAATLRRIRTRTVQVAGSLAHLKFQPTKRVRAGHGTYPKHGPVSPPLPQPNSAAASQFARNSSASRSPQRAQARERVRRGRRFSPLSSSSPSSPSRSFADRQHPPPCKLAFLASCSWIQRHVKRGVEAFYSFVQLLCALFGNHSPSILYCCFNVAEISFHSLLLIWKP